MFQAACASLTLLAVFAAGLFAQGLDTTATKGDWEEINFEFSSSVLVDGYPSLLHLAELLQKNPGYKVKIEGHTDWIGNTPYNDKLAVARAMAVKGFLIKYGARPEQAETLAMRVMLGWSREEIAEYTKAPVNTVRSRMRLAKEALRTRIAADPSMAEVLEETP